MSPELPHLSANNGTATRFASLSVREINNRLTSIKLSAGIIATKAKEDDIKKYLDIIARSADKIDNLVKTSLKAPGAVKIL